MPTGLNEYMESAGYVNLREVERPKRGFKYWLWVGIETVNFWRLGL